MSESVQLTRELVAIVRVSDASHLTTLPVGASLTIASERGEHGLVQAFHGGQLVSVFAEDLVERSKPIQISHEAKSGT